MKINKIENPDWEEVTTYYIEDKNSINIEALFLAISQKEGYEIDFSILNEGVVSEVKPVDIKLFLTESEIEEDLIRFTILDDDWNFKLYYIETSCHYIIRIWETSA